LGGDVAANDQSRLLQLNGANPVASTWSVPGNPTGFFAGSPTEPSIIPGASNANPSSTKPNDGSLFCSDQKQLADGRILAAGGTNYYAEPRVNDQIGVLELEGIKNSRIFDPQANAWGPSVSMKYGRWYPTMTTLADGKVLIASGVTKLIKPVYGPDNTNGVAGSGTNVKQLEVFDPTANNAQGAWSEVVGEQRALGDSSHKSLPLFPRLHLLPTGRVYYDAAGQAFNPFGQSYDEALWNIASVYDPALKSWRDIGVPAPAVDPGVVSQGVTEPGFRGSTFSQMLPLTPDSTGRYTVARFLSAGGVLGTSPGSYQPTDSSRITKISINPQTGEEKLTTSASGKLSAPRWYSSGVTLPNGTVFVVSGADKDEVVTPGSESAIRTAELWNPATGAFTAVGEQARERTYHNSAVLLPDGSVLIGGHSPIPANYGDGNADNPDVPGVRNSAPNHKDASFQIWRPPYLFRGDRPTIATEITGALSGTNLVLNTPDAARLTHVTFVRNPAVTHLVDADQRVVEVPILARDTKAGTVTVSLPDSRVLPAGPYMAFVATGEEATGNYVPSVAKQVMLTAGPAGSGQVGAASLIVPPSAQPPSPVALAVPNPAASNANGPAATAHRPVALDGDLAADRRPLSSTPVSPAPVTIATCGLLGVLTAAALFTRRRARLR
jgi:hypothetical protein